MPIGVTWRGTDEAASPHARATPQNTTVHKMAKRADHRNRQTHTEHLIERLIGRQDAKCLVLLPSLPKSRFVRLATTCKTGDTIYFLVVSDERPPAANSSNGRSQPAPFSNSLPLHARLATARVNTGNPQPLVAASSQRHFKPRGQPSLDSVCCSSKRPDTGEAGCLRRLHRRVWTCCPQTWGRDEDAIHWTLSIIPAWVDTPHHVVSLAR